MPIIIKGIKNFFREPSQVVFMCILPLLLIFLLGNILVTTNEDTKPLEPFSIYYQIKGEELAGISEFINTIQDQLPITFIKTEKHISREAIEKSSGLIIFDGENKSISCYTNEDEINGVAIRGMVNQFASTYSLIECIGKNTPQKLGGIGFVQENAVVNKAIGKTDNFNYIDYYAISMAVMSVFYGLMTAIGLVKEELNFHTMERMVLAGKNKSVIFFQITIGPMIGLIIQILIIMGVSAFVFGAEYGYHPLLFMLMCIMGCMATFAVGTFISIIYKKDPSGIIWTLITLMMLISGIYEPDLRVESLSSFLPAAILNDTAQHLSRTGDITQTVYVIIGLGVIAIIFFILGAKYFKKTEEW